MPAVLFTLPLAGPFQLNNLGCSTTFHWSQTDFCLRTLLWVAVGMVEASLKTCKKLLDVGALRLVPPDFGVS